MSQRIGRGPGVIVDESESNLAIVGGGDWTRDRREGTDPAMRGQDPDGDADDSALVAQVTQASETPSAQAGAAPVFSQTVVGWVTPESTTACLVVDFAGNPAGP